MVVSIHQPCYFPWLGLLNKVKHSDLFIILDVVQFNDAAFQNRTLIRNLKGETFYLSVPVLKKGHLRDNSSLLNLQVANQHRWQKKHSGTIELCYKKTAYYDKHRQKIVDIFVKKWDKLSDLCLETFKFECEILGIKTPYLFASELAPAGNKTELILDICSKVKADTYLSGAGARDYMDLNLFQNAGIKVIWQDFIHPQYPQFSRNDNFVPGMGGIDLIFNCGDSGAKYI